MTKTVGSFVKQWEADLAIALLRGNGLHPDDLRTFSHVTHGVGAGQEYCVTIPETEAEAAVALLEAEGYGKSAVPNR